MPPKRKKKSHAKIVKPVGDSSPGYTDMFSRLEEVQDCLDRAGLSESSCVDGIRKADVVVEQCHDDIGVWCSILMKRARLLFTAVEKKFNTTGISRQHANPLESCIADCEKVLSSVSDDNPATKAIHDDANALSTKAKSMRRSNDGQDVRDKDVLSFQTIPFREAESTPHYDPAKTVFKEVSKINPLLLQDVVNCYKKSKLVCKFCFFRNRRQEIVGHNRYCKQCKCTQPSIFIMPASKMCKNFANMKVIPIGTAPRLLLIPSNRHKPFMYCQNDDHIACLERSAVGDVWFAHFIEELVIWTVERHYRCKFNDFIKKHHKPLDTFSAGTADGEGYKFFPDEISFNGAASIPSHLLNEVIQSFHQMKEFCKWCFYKRRLKGVVALGKSGDMVCNLCKWKWDPVVVIPASQICWNFGDFSDIPIAPWPRSKPNMDPFEYCLKEDHFRCFRVYIESEFWYTHTVEEMVIWTIEREHDCKFADYLYKIKKPPPQIMSPKTSSPSSKIPSPLSPTSPLSPSYSAVAASNSPGGSTNQILISMATQQQQQQQPAATYQPIKTFATGHRVPIHHQAMSGNFNHGVGSDSLLLSAGDPYQLPTFQPVQTMVDGSNTQAKATHYQSTNRSVTYQSNDGRTSMAGGYHQSMAASPGYKFTDHGVSQPSQQSLASGLAGQWSGDRDRSLIPEVFKFTEVTFQNALDVPLHLVQAVAQCFTKKLEVCRRCFYGERSLSSYQEEDKCSLGQHRWLNPILVIPGCNLCDNEPCFKKGEHVAIPPLPPIAHIKKCDNKNHHKCFTKSLESNEWFAHSVEELVVWLFESEKECSFVEYMVRELHFEAPLPVQKLHVQQTVSTNSQQHKLQTIPVQPQLPSRPNYNTTTSKSSPNTRALGAGTMSANASPFPPAKKSTMAAYAIPGVNSTISANASRFGAGTMSANASPFLPATNSNMAAYVVPGVNSTMSANSSPFITSTMSANASQFGAGTMSANASPFLPATNSTMAAYAIPGVNSTMSANASAFGAGTVSANAHPFGGGTMSANASQFGAGTVSANAHPFGGGTTSANASQFGAGTVSANAHPFGGGTMSANASQFGAGTMSANAHPFGGGTMAFGTGTNTMVGNVNPLATPVNSSVVVSPLSPVISTISANIKPFATAVSSAAARPLSAQNKQPEQKQPAKYDPKTTVFSCMDDIPEELLADVALCYKQRLLVCRLCFFESHCMDLSSKKTSRNTCEKGHPWKQIRIIPHCEMCIGPGPFIPIPPLPKHMQHSNSPFVICNKTEHTTCHYMSKTTNPWFPHTVEELVIWTVEREKRCNFEAAYTFFLPMEEKWLEAGQPLDSTNGASAHFQADAVDKLSPSSANDTPSNPNPNLPSIDTLDLTRPQDRELPDNSHPVSSSVLSGFTQPGSSEAVVRVSADMASSSQPPVMQPKSQENDFASYIFRDYSGPQMEASNAMGLPPPGFGQEAPTINGDPLVEGNDELTGTVNDALELFPALRGCSQPLQEELIGAHSQGGGLADPHFSLLPAEHNVLSSSIPTSNTAQQMNPLVDATTHHGFDLTSNNSPTMNGFMPVTSSLQNASHHGSVSGGSVGNVLSGFISSSVHTNTTTTIEESGFNSGISAFSNAVTDQDFVPVADLNSEHWPEISNSDGQLDSDLQYPTAGSEDAKLDALFLASEEDIDQGAVEVYECLLCYLGFKSAEAFADHCKGQGHLQLVNIDCGGDYVWKHLPPPFGKTPEEFAFCPNPIACTSRVNCLMSHYADELSEWRLRYCHRQKRRHARLPDPIPPFANQTPGPLLTPSQDLSQYQALKVTTSEPLVVSTTTENRNVTWRITVQGENWQSLFGVICQTLTPSAFKLMRIEGDTFYTLHPKGLRWEARSLQQAILLGKIDIQVKATPPSVGNYSCEVCFNLGAKQYLYIQLELVVQGTGVSAEEAPQMKDSSEQSPRERKPSVHWQLSTSSDELGIEAEDYTLVHVPIEDQAYSLTDENGTLSSSQNLIS